MVSSRRAAVKDIVLLAIAAVALILAIWMFTRSGSKSDAPTDKFVNFHCTKCGQSFKLSYREFEELWDKPGGKALEGRKFVFKCAKCGEMGAERVDEEPAAGPAAPPAGKSPQKTGGETGGS